MKCLNASRGLGDALYLRAVALHLRERGEAITVFTGWPDVFADLDGVVVKGVSEETGDEDWHHVKPCLHCRIVEHIDQFRMACLQAGIHEPVQLCLDRKVRNERLTQDIVRRSEGRKILVFQTFKRAHNQNQELLRPNIEAFEQIIDSRKDHFRIRLGHPAHVEDHVMPCEMDLFGRVSVSDVLDVATIADLFISEPSYLLILAQALDKPFVCLFSSRARDSGRHRLENISPQRIIHKPGLGSAVYDA